MANILYARASDNVAALATTITASAADAEYPAAYLVDLNPAKPGKLTTTTGSWVFAFASARRVDVVALIHHNLTAGLEVRIQGNATDAWGSPTFNQQITIPAYHEDGFSVCPFLDLTGLAGYSASGFLFWRVVVVGVNAAPVAIGEICLIGTKRTLEVNVSWGAQDGEEHPIVEHRTDHGVSTIVDLGTKWRTFAGEIDGTDVAFASRRSLFRDARGRARPWLFIPDPSVNDAWFVRFQETRDARGMMFLDRNLLGFPVEEVSRGLVL